MSYASAAVLFAVGMDEEAKEVLERTMSVVFGKESGMQFQTPEAW